MNILQTIAEFQDTNLSIAEKRLLARQLARQFNDELIGDIIANRVSDEDVLLRCADIALLITYGSDNT